MSPTTQGPNVLNCVAVVSITPGLLPNYVADHVYYDKGRDAVDFVKTAVPKHVFVDFARLNDGWTGLRVVRAITESQERYPVEARSIIHVMKAHITEIDRVYVIRQGGYGLIPREPQAIQAVLRQRDVYVRPDTLLKKIVSQKPLAPTNKKEEYFPIFLLFRDYCGMAADVADRTYWKNNLHKKSVGVSNYISYLSLHIGAKDRRHEFVCAANKLILAK